jgi:hypothetical protein
MKCTLRINDVIFEPLAYEEIWTGGLLRIILEISESKDLDRLNKMIESEGYYPVIKVGEKKPREMKIQKNSKKNSVTQAVYIDLN